MSEELQSESVETETSETPIQEKSDLATDAEGENSGVQDAINKQHRKYRDEERKRIEVETQLADTQKQLQTLQDENSKPAPIPDVPDQYDDDYEQQIRTRDAAIQAQANFDAKNDILASQQQAQTLAAQKLEQEELNADVQAYSDRAKTLGVSAEDLNRAGALVSSYGLSRDLTKGILKDPNGPLITTYLEVNPLEIDTLRLMNDHDAGVYLERNIRAKAAELKPKTSSTPEPAQQINGGGAQLDDNYPHSAGATFE